MRKKNINFMFERTKNLRLSIIKQIELKASKYPNTISLAQGIPSFDTPECIKGRVNLALKRGVVAKYSLSPGLPELRELIEMHLAQENMFYDWENETYTSYQEVIRLAGCQPVFVSLDEENDWGFNIKKFEEAITPKTKAIFYCNPNNPTGTIYTKEQLLKLAELAEKHNLFLISDEVYKDFTKKKKKIFSLAEIPELRKRIIRIYGFSKAYAMTGWRIGYLHTDEKIAREILKVHDSLVTCAPVISQYAAMGALEMGASAILDFNQNYMERRDLVCQRLDKLNNIFSYIKPQSSYYVFPKIISNNDSWKFVLDLLENTQVALIPGMAFGERGEGHIRISYGRNIKDINEAFDRMEKYFLS